jgi:hypothetical protein
MYDGTGGVPLQREGAVPNPLLYGAGSDILRTGIGAYGEKIFGTSREYVQSNVSIPHFEIYVN